MAEETINPEQEQVAIFTEQFEVQVRTDTFEQGLAKLKQLYDDWQASLGEEATNVIGAGLASGLQQIDKAASAASKDISLSLLNLAASIRDIGGEIGSSFERIMDQVSAKVDSTTADAKQSLTSVGQTLDQEKAKIEAATATKRENRPKEGPDSLTADQAQKRRVLALPENEDLVKKGRVESLTPQQRNARDIEQDSEGTANRTQALAGQYEQWWLKALAAKERAEEAATKRGEELQQTAAEKYEQWWLKALAARDRAEEQTAERQKAFAQGLATDQEGVLNAQLAQLEKVAALRQANDELEARSTARSAVRNGATRDDQVKALQAEIARLKGSLSRNNAELGTAPAANSTTDEDLAREQRRQQLLRQNASTQAQIDSLSNQSKKLQDLTQDVTLQEELNSELLRQADLLSQLNIAREKLGNAGKVSKDSQIAALQTQVAEYTAQVQRAEAEVQRLLALKPTANAPATEAGNRAVKEYDGAVQHLTQTINKLSGAQAQLTSEQQGFFGKMREGFSGFGQEMGDALVTAVKFSTAYKLVFVAIQAVIDTVAAPFKALRDGITYLTDLQDKTTDLSAVIAQNVSYSKDQGENFAIAQRIGVQAMQAIQDKAIEARVPVENLAKTVKALLEAKASGLVGNMNELITLASQMQGIIEHMAPKGQFGGGDFEKSIQDLFNGKANGDNLFIKTALNGNAAQWQEMVDHAKVFHDLLTQLAPSLRPLLDATGKAQLNFSVLLEQFHLLLQRIEGTGASPLFEALSNSLQQLNTWLQENEQSVSNIIAMFGALAQAALHVAASMVEAGRGIGGVGNAAEVVAAFIFPLVAIFTSLASAIDIAATSYKEFKQVFTPQSGEDLDENIQKLENGLKIRQTQRDQLSQDVYRLATDPTFRLGDHPTESEELIKKQIADLRAKQQSATPQPAPQREEPKPEKQGSSASRTIVIDSEGKEVQEGTRIKQKAPEPQLQAAPTPTAASRTITIDADGKAVKEETKAANTDVAQQISRLEALLEASRAARGYGKEQTDKKAQTPEQILPNAAPEVKQALQEFSKQLGDNAILAFSIAKQESQGNQFGVVGPKGNILPSDQVLTSKAGAQGVMQLMPATAQEVNVDPTKTQDNIKGGVAHIARLLKKYNGDQGLVAMAYNWGEGNVDAFRTTKRGLPTKDHPEGAPVPKETTDYVNQVTSRIATTPTTASTVKTLNSPAQPNGAEADKDATKNAEKAFRSAKESYDSQISDLKIKSDEVRRALTTSAQEGLTSHEEAAKKITAETTKELTDFNAYSKDILEKAYATRAAIANDSFASPEAKKLSLEGADTEITRIRKQIAEQRAQIEKTTDSPDKAAAQERKAILKQGYDEEYALQAQAIQAQRSLLQESAAEGRLTKLQEFDAQRALDAQEHAALLNKLNQEAVLTRTADNTITVQHQKALDDLTREEEAYTDKLRLQAEQRRQTAYQQMLQQQRDAAALRGARINTAEATQSVRSQVDPVKGVFGSDDQEVIDLRRSDLEIQTQQKEQELTHALAEAKGQETEKTAELRVELERLHATRLQLLQDEISQRTSGSNTPQIQTQQTLREDLKRQEADRSQTQSDISKTKGKLEDVTQQVATTDNPVVTEALQRQADDLVAHLEELNLHLKDVTQSIKTDADVLKESQPSFKKAADEALKDVFGPDVKHNWENANGAVAKFGVAVQDLPNVVDRVKQEIGIFNQGRQTGGVAGGIGALLSEGPLSDILSKIPVVGAFVKPVGEMITMVESAFRAGARHIAAEVTAQFDQTTKDISSGVVGLGLGITQVNSELNEAITRLTEKSQEGIAGLPTAAKVALNVFSPITSLFDNNGAIAELNKILPPMVEQLEQLLRQQAQVFSEFDMQLKSLQLQSDTLGQINSQWQSINATVAKYLDAGGDAVKANQMISLGLQQIVRESGAELTQGYDQAVQDAIQLNDLALQRYNLELQFKNQSFDLVNADSIERMQAGTVTRGQQLQQLKTQYQQQLDSLNSQIDLEDKKVTAERQIFDIAQSISDLHRQDESLQLVSLQLQLQKYKDLQNAVGAITSGAATPGAGNPALSSQLKDIDTKIADYSTRIKVDQSKPDGQNQSANDTSWLLQLLQTQKTLAQQLSDSAGGSLAGTGEQGGYQNAVEAAQAALNSQATYAAANTGASPWYRDVGGYITQLTSTASGLAQTQASLLSGSSAPTIGVNPGAYDPSQLSLSGLQGLLNNGYSANQNNNISITVNIPDGTSTTNIGNTIADSVTQALASQQRQAIIG